MTIINAAVDEPRIYVASLSDYNAGVLHGVWVDVYDVDVAWEEIQKMLDSSPTAKREGLPAEEVAIHDYEGFFGVRIGEHSNIEWVCEQARLIEKHGEAWTLWADHVGTDDDDGFDSAYIGEFTSEEDFAYEEVWSNTDMNSIPDIIKDNINYSYVWEDLRHDYTLIPNSEGNFFAYRDNY